MKYQTFHPAILVEIEFQDGVKEVELTGTVSYTSAGEGNLDCIGWDNTIYSKEENKVIDKYVLTTGVNLEGQFIQKIDLESYN